MRIRVGGHRPQAVAHIGQHRGIGGRRGAGNAGIAALPLPGNAGEIAIRIRQAGRDRRGAHRGGVVDAHRAGLVYRVGDNGREGRGRRFVAAVVVMVRGHRPQATAHIGEHGGVGGGRGAGDIGIAALPLPGQRAKRRVGVGQGGPELLAAGRRGVVEGHPARPVRPVRHGGRGRRGRRLAVGVPVVVRGHCP